MRLVPSAALALAAAAALTACGTAREVEQELAISSECTRCHALALGPPLEISGQIVSTHEFHIDKGVECAACHPGYAADTQTTNAATHGDGSYEASVEAGTFTKTVSFSDATPTWPASCLDCHTELPPL